MVVPWDSCESALMLSICCGTVLVYVSDWDFRVQIAHFLPSQNIYIYISLGIFSWEIFVFLNTWVDCRTAWEKLTQHLSQHSLSSTLLPVWVTTCIPQSVSCFGGKTQLKSPLCGGKKVSCPEMWDFDTTEITVEETCLQPSILVKAYGVLESRGEVTANQCLILLFHVSNARSFTDKN